MSSETSESASSPEKCFPTSSLQVPTRRSRRSGNNKCFSKKGKKRSAKQRADKTSSTNNCVFCSSNVNDEFTTGKLLYSDGIHAHYYCMLFSSGLLQRGKEDSDGLVGFLPADIKKEVARGRRLRCYKCKGPGATIGCCEKTCRKAFHYVCSIGNKNLHQFYGQFPTFCASHCPPLEVRKLKPGVNDLCCICCEEVDLDDAIGSIIPPCCLNGTFHKQCIQKQAIISGYFFKCPLCNNKDEFQKEVLEHGVYIPEQDAAWELEQGAFHELYERHSRCDQQQCLCPKGRDYDFDDTKWEVVLCGICGSEGSHIGCMDPVPRVDNVTWRCSSCTQVIIKLDKSKKSPKMLRSKKVRRSSVPKCVRNIQQRRSSRSPVESHLRPSTPKEIVTRRGINLKSAKIEIPNLPLEYKLRVKGVIKSPHKEKPEPVVEDCLQKDVSEGEELSENIDKAHVIDDIKVGDIKGEDSDDEVQFLSAKILQKHRVMKSKTRVAESSNPPHATLDNLNDMVKKKFHEQGPFSSLAGVPGTSQTFTQTSLARRKSKTRAAGINSPTYTELDYLNDMVKNVTHEQVSSSQTGTSQTLTPKSIRRKSKTRVPEISPAYVELDDLNDIVSYPVAGTSQTLTQKSIRKRSKTWVPDINSPAYVDLDDLNGTVKNLSYEQGLSSPLAGTSRTFAQKSTIERSPLLNSLLDKPLLLLDEVLTLPGTHKIAVRQKQTRKEKTPVPCFLPSSLSVPSLSLPGASTPNTIKHQLRDADNCSKGVLHSTRASLSLMTNGSGHSNSSFDSNTKTCSEFGSVNASEDIEPGRVSHCSSGGGSTRTHVSFRKVLEGAIPKLKGNICIVSDDEDCDITNSVYPGVPPRPLSQSPRIEVRKRKRKKHKKVQLKKQFETKADSSDCEVIEVMVRGPPVLDCYPKQSKQHKPDSQTSSNVTVAPEVPKISPLVESSSNNIQVKEKSDMLAPKVGPSDTIQALPNKVSLELREAKRLKKMKKKERVEMKNQLTLLNYYKVSEPEMSKKEPSSPPKKSPKKEKLLQRSSVNASTKFRSSIRKYLIVEPVDQKKPGILRLKINE